IPSSPTPLSTLTSTRRPNTATPTEQLAETNTPRPTTDVLATASAIAASATEEPTAETPTAAGSGEATALPPSETARVSPAADPSVTRQTPTIDASSTVRATSAASPTAATRTPAMVSVVEDEGDSDGSQMLLVALLIAAGLAIIGVSQATRRPK